MSSNPHQVYFVIGVAGSGKSTIGQQLALSLKIPFFDADDFHPKSNISKMKAGQPLTDDDRKSWLENLNKVAIDESRRDSIVIACSALKESYRKILSQGVTSPVWFYLDGSFDTISKRMDKRKGHFMPASLLQSQFDILEVPDYAISIDIELSTEEILASILRHIKHDDLKIGIIGMGVMGRSLARNFGRNGVPLSLYNQFVQGKEEQIAAKAIKEHKELKSATGFENLEEFVQSLPTPRVIISMIPAGLPVDQLIAELKPLLQDGDILIDGGNSHYKDTERRQADLGKQGIEFIGCGISGGEEGALNGPSMMFGGSPSAYQIVKASLEQIAAKDKAGKACLDLIGHGGSGHFVKMVHNGIEYGEMELLAEVYGILRWGHEKNPEEIADLFETWSNTDVSSYLLSVSIDVLRKKEGKVWLIDLILDKAQSKGTGGWTIAAAAELGVAIPTIADSLFARFSSVEKKLRTELNDLLPLEVQPIEFFPDSLMNAYQLARIINHHQGFHLIKHASDQHGWHLNLSELARIWTNGCIIRSSLMERLVDVLKQDQIILQNNSMQELIRKSLDGALSVVPEAIKANIPIPALCSALIYLQTMTRGISNANFIQAQRDYFGAHGYQRVDDTSDKNYHTNWKR